MSMRNAAFLTSFVVLLCFCGAAHAGTGVEFGGIELEQIGKYALRAIITAVLFIIAWWVYDRFF